MATDYVLSLTETELVRYRRMAEVARRDEGEIWRRAGIGPGAVVADIGCGPGAVTVELADVVGPSGAVIAVDADPSALVVAAQMVADRGFGNVSVCQGDATATGIEPASVDAAVIRHVLAHNGGHEQAIVDHAASLLRPGGTLLVVDVDLTAQRLLPDDADLTDLQQRYVQLHRARGNDPSIGLRLAQLLAEANLSAVEHRGWYTLIAATPGVRPPAWIARDAIVSSGLATIDDVERWSSALHRADDRPMPPTIFVAAFAATGVNPGTLSVH